MWNKRDVKREAHQTGKRKGEKEEDVFNFKLQGTKAPIHMTRETTRITWSLVDSDLPSFLQGKFIRIHFGTTGKLASADIETCE